jgi:diguanylate cyclase (GGDEF)-like protein/PAS domain S-box-containing protein
MQGLSTRSRLALATALVAAFAAVAYLAPLAPEGRRLFVDAAWTLAALGTALACFMTAARLHAQERRAWVLFGLAALSWAAGMLVWDYAELARGDVTPFPGWADAGFLAFAPLFVGGLYCYGRTRPSAVLTLKEFADLGVFVSAVAGACLVVFYQPLANPALSLAYKVTALAYPVFYFSGLIACLVWMLNRRWGPRSHVVLGLAVVSGLHAATNTVYAHALLQQRYETGSSTLDLVWIIAFVLMYAAALEARAQAHSAVPAQPAAASPWPSRFDVWLAPLTLTLVLGTVILFRDQIPPEFWLESAPVAISFVVFLGLREWARVRIEQTLRDDVTRVLETVLDTYYRTDAEGRLVRVSAAVQQLLGYTEAELLGHRLAELYVEPDGREKFVAALTAAHGVIYDYQAPLRHKDGHAVWVSTNAKLLRDARGQMLGVEGTTRDVSERRRTEQQMAKLSSALTQTADLVMITDRHGMIEYVNPAFERCTGFTRAEVLGRRPELLKSSKQDAAFYRALWGTVLGGEAFSEIMVNRKKDGTYYYEAKTITPIKDARGDITHFISTGKDITEQMQAQERTQFLAHHDSLTELPNRALLLDRLKQALAHARWHRRLVAVLFLDLDRFKTINDSLGHDIGDALLREIAQRLRACVRERDTIARHGGDEFVILLDDVASDEDISQVAQKVLAGLAPPFDIAGHELHISASIGVSFYPADGSDSQTLLKNADIAMYRAKEAGKATFRFYAADMSARAVERLTFENFLRHALARNEFELYYQPQFDSTRMRVVGVEALIRWRHPQLGLVAPSEFVPLLEETGLIRAVGAWVLREACAELQRWQRLGFTRLRMAVNLSAHQLDDTALPALVAEQLQQHALRPAQLELEMTESAVMRGGAALDQRLAALAATGVRLAIDDFGTGYSSLSHLRRFAFDTIKIDRSFTRDVTVDPDDAAIVAAIAGMTKSLGLTLIVEGVEDKAQLEFLKRHGCRLVQGYLFCEPLCAEDFRQFLRKAVGPARPRAAKGAARNRKRRPKTARRTAPTK